MVNASLKAISRTWRRRLTQHSNRPTCVEYLENLGLKAFTQVYRFASSIP
jgi:hypothetical protein